MWETHVCVVSVECADGECPIELVSFMINIIQCRGLDLKGQT